MHATLKSSQKARNRVQIPSSKVHELTATCQHKIIPEVTFTRENLHIISETPASVISSISDPGEQMFLSQ